MIIQKGMIEGVAHGLLRDPFAVVDMMFAHIKCCCFIEPQSDFMAVVTKFGKIAILECDSGEPVLILYFIKFIEAKLTTG